MFIVLHSNLGKSYNTHKLDIYKQGFNDLYDKKNIFAKNELEKLKNAVIDSKYSQILLDYYVDDNIVADIMEYEHKTFYDYINDALDPKKNNIQLLTVDEAINMPDPLEMWTDKLCFLEKQGLDLDQQDKEDAEDEDSDIDLSLI